MKNYIFICIFSFVITKSQVGINTPTPTKTLDINGELRIRNITEEIALNQVLTSDSQGNIGKLSNTLPLGFIYGDIKTGFQTIDHEGWYLLDGRLISSLPTNIQNRAVNLGFVNSIPDARGKFLKATSDPNAVSQSGGSDTVSLSQANLPNYNYTGSSSSDNASHSHVMTPDVYQLTSSSPGGLLVDLFPQDGTGGNNRFNHTETAGTSTSGSHFHSFSIANAGGSGTAINITPEYILTNTFIYLGK